jgi:two-component system, LytTR family, sensor kinase
LFSLKKNIHWKVWVLVLLVLAIHVYFLHGVAHYGWLLSFYDSICSTIILSSAAWFIILLIRSYPTTAAIYPYAVTISLIISIITTGAQWETLKWWVVHNNEAYRVWALHSMPVRFLATCLVNMWMATNSALRKNIAALETRYQQQADASVLLKEAELFKLRQQLQPHFLYNSLNSISALIMIAPDKAQEMIGKLSDFLRSSVQRESEDTLPVKDELAYIQSYLAIEAIRFGDRLQINIDTKCKDTAILPPFLLQPILENAIKFGLYGKTGAVGIDINITSDKQMLVISVANPYDVNVQPPKGTGFGLEGIRRRLYLLYARTDLLETKKDDRNFTTILKIPQPNV